jgi:hypothetical protein
MRRIYVTLMILCILGGQLCTGCARDEFEAVSTTATLVKIDYRPDREDSFRYVYHWTADEGKITYWTHSSKLIYQLGVHVCLHTKF